MDSLRALFPLASIILVKAFTSFYWTGQGARESMLAPVCDLILKETRGGNTFRGLLLHILSNGGGFQFMTLHKIFSKESNTNHSEFPRNTPVALILDSTPGDHGLQSAIASSTPRNPILHLLSIPPITLVYILVYVMNFLSGNSPFYKDLRSTLMYPDLLPSLTSAVEPKTIPRLYVYSESDKMSIAKDVKKHADEAVRQGFNVTVENFGKSGHVAHARTNPERYWSVISQIWERATKLSGSVPAVL